MTPVLHFFNNEYFRFALIAALSFLAATVFHFIINQYIKKFTDKTSNTFDDQILKIVSRPLYIAICLTGLFFALQAITFSDKAVIWIDRIFFTLMVIIAASILSQLLIILIGNWLRVEKRFEKTPHLVGRIITVVIYLLGFVMVLNYFKINITPIIATLGIGGLAAGLALQSTLSNFFAGLHIISDKSFTVGDLIEINQMNVSGHIEDIGWRTTRIKTLGNNIAIVPNSKLAESVIINTELPQKEVTVTLNCGVAYNSDLQKVESVTLNVAKQIHDTIDGAVNDFTSAFRYHTFGDSNILFTVSVKVRSFNDKPFVIHEFIKLLKSEFEKENIEMSWPVRKVYQHTF
jgi:small-conductance mechanosensitive channel